MGLGGRKTKQRIGSDPRNLSWADDASKFGQSYLSKFGWDPSKGLGVNGDGRTSHVKVAQKLNLMGIGAGAQQGPDGIAWKQNKEYELLLARLNATSPEEEKLVEEEVVENGGKRKRDEEVAGEEDERKKRKREKKEEKERRKEEKRAKKSKKGGKTESTDGAIDSEQGKPTVEVVASSSNTTVQAPTPRPMAHRARFLKSKKLASASSAAMAEILGVSGSSTPFSTPASGSATPSIQPASSTDSSAPETIQELTTSVKSVADYFKEKLAMRSRSQSVAAPEAGPSSSSAGMEADPNDDRPRIGLGMKRVSFADVDFSPRIGLGMAKQAVAASADTSAASEDENRAENGDDASKDDVKRPDSGKKKQKNKEKSGEGAIGDAVAADDAVEDTKEEKRRKKERRKEKKRKASSDS